MANEDLIAAASAELAAAQADLQTATAFYARLTTGDLGRWSDSRQRHVPSDSWLVQRQDPNAMAPGSTRYAMSQLAFVVRSVSTFPEPGPARGTPAANLEALVLQAYDAEVKDAASGMDAHGRRVSDAKAAFARWAWNVGAKR